MSATILPTVTETRPIIEGGEQMDIPKAQLKKVRHLVYWCPECKAYHLKEGKDFEDIEIIIGK